MSSADSPRPRLTRWKALRPGSPTLLRAPDRHPGRRDRSGVQRQELPRGPAPVWALCDSNHDAKLEPPLRAAAPRLRARVWRPRVCGPASGGPASAGPRLPAAGALPSAPACAAVTGATPRGLPGAGQRGYFALRGYSACATHVKYPRSAEFPGKGARPGRGSPGSGPPG